MRTQMSWLALSLAVIAPASGLIAQSSRPASSQQQADAGIQTAIDGKWKMTVDVESADRVSTLEIKLDGKKVSGTLTPPSGEYPIVGEFSDGTLRFTSQYRDLVLNFTGALKDDGTLAGTLDYGEGPANWTAERIKEK